MAENYYRIWRYFYRVWRKYLPRTSTDVHGNTVYKSKYVNTSKIAFMRQSRGVWCRVYSVKARSLIASLFKTFHLFLYLVKWQFVSRSGKVNRTLARYNRTA